MTVESGRVCGGLLRAAGVFDLGRKVRQGKGGIMIALNRNFTSTRLKWNGQAG
jgi:hypothetical protein